MMLKTLCCIVLLTAFTSSGAQTGMMYEEFKGKLKGYFDDELIADLDEYMPQGAQFRVWGWDVGDFSGDGYNDVSFSINVIGTRKKECAVFLFVDSDGFLVNVARYQVPYVELPLEVGVVIRDTTCYLAQKKRAEYWMMRGYRYRYGSVILFDEFVSNRVQAFAHEGYRNYLSLETKDRYLTSEGVSAMSIEYLSLPCYERGRQLYAGVETDVVVESIKNVKQGAFWWYGLADGSFRVRTVYDDEYLYLRISVLDSNVVTGWCDTCVADRLELWFDITPADELGGSRYIKSIERSKIEMRSSSDSGLYAFAITIGDFADVRSSVKIRTTDDLDIDQNAALQRVRVVTSPRADGYVVKVRIPFNVLGYAKAPVDESDLTELGCSIVLYDVDNDFRPEETSVIATSQISPLNPSTYGSLVFIPANQWYGETTNIFSEAVFSALRELGF